MYWLRQRIHPTWHLTALTFGFVAGASLALVWWIPPWIGYTSGILLSGFVFWQARRFLLVVIFCAGSLLGLARASTSLSAQVAYQKYYDQSVVLSGRVADDVDKTTRGQHITLQDISINSQKLPGKIFVSSLDDNDIKRSDNIKLKGVLQSGFGSFVATVNGNILSIDRPVPGDVALKVRDDFASNVRSSISEPEASLGIGYLLGQKSTLPSGLIEALKVTGLTHAVVASGYNLTILVRLARRIFAKYSRYLAVLSGICLIVGFMAMTGLSPSMSRAGLVTGLGLWAWYFGRNFHPLTILGISASVTVAINPSYVWGDLGWLLSFSAFGGVMLLAPIISAYLFGDKKIPFVAQLLIETISAQIATLPIMIIAFQQFSVVAPVANLLILPLIPLIMLLVTLAGIGTYMIPTLATIIGFPAQALLEFQVNIINWCADLPWALQKPQWLITQLVLYVAIVVIVTLHMKLRSGYKLYRASVVE